MIIITASDALLCHRAMCMYERHVCYNHVYTTTTTTYTTICYWTTICIMSVILYDICMCILYIHVCDTKECSTEESI